MKRTLRVTSPLMRGADVTTAQQHLISRGYLNANQQDGVYGPVTANATKRAKWMLGYPANDVTPVYGSMLDDYLAGKRKPGAVMRARAAARKRQAAKNAKQITVGARAADRMVKWYAAGWKEHPAGSNHVDQLSALCKSLGLSAYYVRMGFPWCALGVFVSALAEGSKAAVFGLKDGKFNALYTPEIQSVAERGAYGLRAIGKANIRKGVGLLFDFDGGGVDHVGYALAAPGVTVVAGGRTWKPTAQQVVTVECNTSYAENTTGSQSNGGCVAIRIRDLSLIATAFTIT